MDDTMSLKQRFCTFWGTFNESHPDLKMTLFIAFFVVFLFYLLEIVREVIDEWEVTVGTRGQWVVLLFTLFLAVWVADPWGWCVDNDGPRSKRRRADLRGNDGPQMTSDNLLSLRATSVAKADLCG